MLDPSLDVYDDLPGIGLVPAPIEVLGHQTQLDDEVTGQVRWLDFSALFLPQPHEGGFVRPHDNPGIGTADEQSATKSSCAR